MVFRRRWSVVEEKLVLIVGNRPSCAMYSPDISRGKKKPVSILITARLTHVHRPSLTRVKYEVSKCMISARVAEASDGGGKT